MRIAFRLNGAPVEIDTDARANLVEVVRELGYTGAKEGCGVGVCGVCTILVDGRPVSGCLYLAPCAAGADIWTVEGLTAIDTALRDAFVTEEGFQCGVCTPGQVVAAYALKRAAPDADRDGVRDFMAGNLCRCTGYESIISSVRNYLDRK